MPKESDAALAARVEALNLSLWTGDPVYCWDLDSTVCSTVHRRHMVPAVKAAVAVVGENAWDDYAMACADDTPIAGTVELMHELKNRSTRVIHIAISGRSGLAEQLTYEWLQKHAVPLDGVLLRAHGDHTPNGKYKTRVLKALKAAGADVRLFFEDWSEAAAEIGRETGIPVVGINPFDPEEFPAKQGAI